MKTRMFANILYSILMILNVYSQLAASPNVDPSENNGKILSPEAREKIQKLRVETIKSLKELLDRTTNASHRYELLKRLGEQYAEQSEYALERELELYEQRYTAWQKKPHGSKPTPDHSLSQKSLEKAVQIYREVIENYASYPTVDVTYYELGKTLLRFKDKSGVDYLKTLVTRFPNSTFVPEALFGLGEYYFENVEDMVTARQYYNDAAKFKDHRIYPYALYKLGWVYYNYPAETQAEEIDKYRKAVTAFKLVVKVADVRRKDNPSDRGIYLRDEAINDLIMVWAETEDVDSAWAYFREMGDENSFYKMLERLGDIYVEQGKREDAAKVFKRILTEVPLRSSNPENHTKLLGVYADALDLKEITKEAQRAVALYRPEGVWCLGQPLPAKDLNFCANARLAIEKSLHRHATYFHQEAQKRKYSEFYITASELYRIYLDAFSDQENAYELRYLYADVLFEIKKYQDAAQQYFLVAQSREKNGKYFHDAALNAVIAHKKNIEIRKFASPQSYTTQIEIPAPLQSFQQALDYYSIHFSQNTDSHPMRISAAKISFEYGHLDDAIKRYESIALELPKTPQAKESIETILNFFQKQKNWDATIKYSRLFLSKNSSDAGVMAATHKLLVYASFERALVLEKTGHQLDAAQAFLDFQKEFRDDAQADDAIYNAMVIFFRLGKVNAAVAAAHTLTSSYPKFERLSDVMLTLAETRERLGEYEKAAEAYSRFAHEFATHPKAASSAYSSAVILASIEHLTDAEKEFRYYLKAFPNDDKHDDARFALAEILDKRNDLAGAAFFYADVVSHSKPNSNEFWLAKLHLASLADHSSSKKDELAGLYKQLMKTPKETAIGAKMLLAQLMITEAQSQFEVFYKTKIEGLQLEKTIQRKQQKLVAAAAMAENIIKLGDIDSSLLSLKMLAEAHLTFAKNLTEVTLSSEVDETQKESIRKALSELAAPLKNQGLSFYKSAYSLSEKSHRPSTTAQQIMLALNELDAPHFPKVKEPNLSPQFLTHEFIAENEVKK